MAAVKLIAILSILFSGGAMW